jgi:hypothetical protein
MLSLVLASSATLIFSHVGAMELDAIDRPFTGMMFLGIVALGMTAFSSLAMAVL